MEYTKLFTVAVFDDLPNAHIALGRLDAEGIDAALQDANFVQMDWLYAIALGGIKVQVEEKDVDRARKILATDYSDDIDDDDREL
ncbi:MAG TPA: DUF2007 domain-containing protein [Gammaproteobacteria bacterium]|nr:DUF2007 domain-containing protein [Gammaproteobacteria bacterium]